MKQFVISPLISVGEVEFGIDRSKAREILGDYSEYRNNPDDINTADCFDVCQVFYNERNGVEFVMFHELDDVELIWEDQILNKMTKMELFSYFMLLDVNLRIEDDMVSFESNELGVACYFVEDICFDEDDNEIEFDKVETISFAVKDFWK